MEMEITPLRNEDEPRLPHCAPDTLWGRVVSGLTRG